MEGKEGGAKMKHNITIQMGCNGCIHETDDYEKTKDACKYCVRNPRFFDAYFPKEKEATEKK